MDLADYEQSRIDLHYGDGEFHVFTINDLIDSTNSMASPYSWFPIFETGNTIDAINWVPPMTIRWDTSLFHAPYLPYSQGHIGKAIMGGEYFWANSNHPELEAFDMLIDDSVVVSTYSQYLFPFGVLFGQSDGIGIQEHGAVGHLSLWPNPATKELTLYRAEHPLELRIFDAVGREVLGPVLYTPSGLLDISALKAGTYFIQARSSTNHQYHVQFIKEE